MNLFERCNSAPVTGVADEWETDMDVRGWESAAPGIERTNDEQYPSLAPDGDASRIVKHAVPEQMVSKKLRRE